MFQTTNQHDSLYQYTMVYHNMIHYIHYTRNEYTKNNIWYNIYIYVVYYGINMGMISML